MEDLPNHIWQVLHIYFDKFQYFLKVHATFALLYNAFQLLTSFAKSVLAMIILPFFTKFYHKNHYKGRNYNMIFYDLLFFISHYCTTKHKSQIRHYDSQCHFTVVQFYTMVQKSIPYWVYNMVLIRKKRCCPVVSMSDM